MKVTAFDGVQAILLAMLFLFRKARVPDAQVYETGSVRAIIEPNRVDGVPL